MPTKFELTVEVQGGHGVPSFSGTLRNVNVILGANGTGKSKLLNQIRDQAPSLELPERVIYVEGGRVVTPPDTVQLDRNTFQPFQTLTSARQQHSGRRAGLLRDRTHYAFLLLKKTEDENKLQHSDQVEEWRKGGRIGDLPTRSRPPLDELFELFHRVFPEITLEMLPDSLQLQCTKNAMQYSPSGLSDGEKQALCLLADIALLADESSLIIVDEPELNLHPHLAEDLWNAIELRYPDCVFIYATHNIAFSMRSHVDAVFILGRANEPSIAIDSPLDLDPNDLRPFLGAIPAILASDQCLIVEGTEKSFDAVFYRWVIDRPTLVIEPMGGASDVAGAAKGSGVWSRVAPSMKIVGVIDRDFRSDEELGGLAADHLSILELHEAESFLCDPKIIHAVASALGSIDPIPTEEEVVAKILDYAKETLFYVVAQRIFRRLAIPLRPSLLRAECRSLANEADLLAKIKAGCAEEKSKAVSKLDKNEVEAAFNSELHRCKSLVDSNDIAGMLKVFEGKQLLARLHRYAACPHPEAVARAASHHLKLDDYPRLMQLRDNLRTNFSL